MNKNMAKEIERALAISIANRGNTFISNTLLGGMACPTQDLVAVISAKETKPNVTRVKFNDPATIVWFSDGDKVVCVCDERDYYDREKGVLHCIAKKFLGSTHVKALEVEWGEE